MKLLDYHALHRQEQQSWNVPELQRVALDQDASFLRRLQELTPDPAARFSGNLLTLDRGSLYDTVAALCRLYDRATPEQRTCMRALAAGSETPRLAAQLEGFALRAATAGLRDGAPETVRLGVMAFALRDIGRDVRDALLSIALLFHCAQRCGADANALFAEVAFIAGPAMSAVLLDYAVRPPGLQSIAMMGWKEAETPEGPGFRRM